MSVILRLRAVQVLRKALEGGMQGVRACLTEPYEGRREVKPSLV